MKHCSILIPDGNCAEIVQFEDIIYCQANGSYCNIFLSDSRKMLISRNLSWLSRKIDADYFFRVHKSFFINLWFVCKINKIESRIYLVNNTNIPVARDKKQELWDKLSGLRRIS